MHGYDLTYKWILISVHKLKKKESTLVTFLKYINLLKFILNLFGFRA